MKEIIILLVAGGIIGFVWFCYWLVGKWSTFEIQAEFPDWDDVLDQENGEKQEKDIDDE